MVTFFDWKRLRDLKPHDLVMALQNEDLGINRDSYLINAHKLIDNEMNATDSEIYVYVHLAALRNYYEYKYNKNNRLNRYAILDYDTEKLKMNRLLKIEDNEVIFMYEEK